MQNLNEKEETIIVFYDNDTLMPGELEEGDSYTGGLIYTGEEEELENINTLHLLKKELGIPFLFLSCGTHYKLQRLVGPMMGGCMHLCVQQHEETSAKCKPVLRAAKQVMDYADYLPDV